MFVSRVLQSARWASPWKSNEAGSARRASHHVGAPARGVRVGGAASARVSVGVGSVGVGVKVSGASVQARRTTLATRAKDFCPVPLVIGSLAYGWLPRVLT